MNRLLLYCKLVKIEHSVFALPFAYMGLFLASQGKFNFKEFTLVTLAMITIRSFAMAINRILDLPFDKQNPRTKDRPLVTGEISLKEAIIFSVVCAIIFILSCALLNKFCFKLSFIAIFLTGFYSLTKRFTFLSHFWLGAVLGLAPLGSWLAHTPSFSSITPILLFLGVMFWVAGFDILYACQDVSFDKKVGLHSLPKSLGIDSALYISLFCHVNASLFFFLTGFSASLGKIYFISCLLISFVLIWEHKLVKPDDLSRVNLAFFTMNGFVSIFLFLAVLMDIIYKF